MYISGKPLKNFPISTVINNESPPPIKGGSQALIGSLTVTDNDISWNPLN